MCTYDSEHPGSQNLKFSPIPPTQFTKFNVYQSHSLIHYQYMYRTCIQVQYMYIILNDKGITISINLS